MENLKRKDLFTVNPRAVTVTWEDNPRSDYGDSDFQELKESIRQCGIKDPVRVYPDKENDTYKLAHGFRRMKAVLELIEEGEEIALIPCLKVKNNAESILFEHLVLNSGKPLNSVEQAVVMTKLKSYGYTAEEIGKKTGIAYPKVISLIKFSEEASKQIQESVRLGEMKFNTAMEIIRSASSTEEQNDLLEKARDEAVENNSTVVKKKNVEKASRKVTFEKHYSKLEISQFKGINLKDLWKSGYKIVKI